MGIFNKQRPQLPEFPGTSFDSDQVNYNSVLQYLVDIEDKDHEKLTKLAKIYRDANTKADAIIGDVDETPEEQEELDPLDAAFLDADDEPKPKAKK